MNKFFLALIFAASTLVVAGGCVSRSLPEPEGYSVPSPSVEMPKQEEATSTVVADTRPECQRIEDDYTGPILVVGRFQDSMMRVEKYPISGKYKHLEKVGPVEIGEGGASILARLFTAADCSKEQVERMFGAGIEERMPISIYFSVNHPSADFQSLLQNGSFDFLSDTKKWYFPSHKATIKDIAELRFFADMISEAGD